MSFDEKTLIHIRVHLPVTYSPNFKNSTKRLSASLQRVFTVMTRLPNRWLCRLPIVISSWHPSLHPLLVP